MANKKGKIPVAGEIYTSEQHSQILIHVTGLDLPNHSVKGHLIRVLPFSYSEVTLGVEPTFTTKDGKTYLVVPTSKLTVKVGGQVWAVALEGAPTVRHPS